MGRGGTRQAHLRRDHQCPVALVHEAADNREDLVASLDSERARGGQEVVLDVDEEERGGHAGLWLWQWADRVGGGEAEGGEQKAARR